jgi:hypothetical protein
MLRHQFGNIVRVFEPFLHIGRRPAIGRPSPSFGMNWEDPVRYETGIPSYSCLLVIPTNVGWDRTGANVMGAGLARVYRDKEFGLAESYGNFLRSNTPRFPEYYSGELVKQTQIPLAPAYIYIWKNQYIMFPTKALDIKRPWISWKQDSSLTLIERSLIKMTEILEKCLNVSVFLPIPGCGKGNLSPKEVLPLLVKYLTPTEIDYVLVSTIDPFEFPAPPPPPTEAERRVAAMTHNTEDEE